MSTLWGSQSGQKQQFQSATGELYYWSVQDDCYIFQSGRRVDRNGSPVQDPMRTPRTRLL